MLPQSLWALVASLLISSPSVWAQNSPTPLSFGTPVALTGNNFSVSTVPLLFSLPSPSSSSDLTISLALCAAASSNPPSVFVSNSSSPQVIPGPSGGADVFPVTIGSLGLGNFTLQLSAATTTTTGVLAVYGGTASDSLEIGVSEGTTTPLHAPLAGLPFFGDSTANGALLFSPPFFRPPPATQPTYPNYTLPPANLSLPSPPPTQNTPNFTLFMAPLSAGFTSLPQTACAIRNARAAQSPQVLEQVLEQQLWLRDAREGWRVEWLVGGLEPLTNYSVYAVQDDTRLAGPIYFTTKSASFSCSLVHALPYCPTTAYTVPLFAPPPSPAFAYDASSLPDNLTSPLINYLSNFTTSLLTMACGRDIYSPIHSCADCQVAYRHWLCTVSFPRCGEFPQQPQATTTPSQQQQVFDAAVPSPALLSMASGTLQRNGALGNVSTPYTTLLPCIETCSAADRACPIFLGFRCPLTKYTANASYGLGFIDSWDGEAQGRGVPGVAQDQWGNVFCNAS